MRRISVLLALSASLWATAALADDDLPWMNERKILGSPNLEPIEMAKDTSAYDWSRGIARVEHSADGHGFCTASRVGERLFLTNIHCSPACETIQFTLGYETSVAQTQRLTYKCKRLIKSNTLFDYALFEAELVTDDSKDQILELSGGGYPILALAYGPLYEGQHVLLPQHPHGRSKEIDRSDECQISSVLVFETPSKRQTIKHMCDTEGGSSGAPLLDRETGRIIALHWGGMAGEYNMAIPMRLVIEDLNQAVEAKEIDAADFEALTITD